MKRDNAILPSCSIMGDIGTENDRAADVRNRGSFRRRVCIPRLCGRDLLLQLSDKTGNAGFGLGVDRLGE
jgi:hypothetical protein